MKDKEYAEILKGLLVPIHAEPAMDRAIELLEQEPVLDKIRAEIIDKYMTATGEVNTVAKGCLQIIDKYKAERSGE